ncbi:MAG: HD domain-containing protein [Candidatus Eisenbacteria bacterium]|nr:HD domain-containing protein [Candidatus Eisenbacteria bacterium]
MRTTIDPEVLRLREENLALMDELEGAYQELAQVVQVSKEETDVAYAELRTKIVELEHRVGELVRLGEVGKVLSSELRLDVLMNVLMAKVEDLVKYDVACFMVGCGNGEYEIVAERGIEKGLVGRKGKIGEVGGEVLIVGDFERAGEAVGSFRLIPEARSGVVMEMGRQGYGLLVLNSYERETFKESAKVFLLAFATQASIAIENAKLYKNLEKIVVGVMISLITALEAKDSYTEGHSQRVAWYAVVLGRKLGLKGTSLEGLHRAGLIHDVGKIGIGESIIGKKGKLTHDEVLQMNLHPVLGESIVKPINLLGSILPAIRLHHERYDGKGYPSRLRGEAIPIEARILLVADAFDAMTSNRPYRKAMTPQEAMREIQRNSGAQFDPKVVRALESCFEEIAGGLETRI